ncbi:MULTISPECIES: dihydroxyacetone kinase family protein [unclassified Actinopolyspora]|uniref:dihydroxyacetone kinase family protein n=1 Tax=unclassified Actinopolyspora TaxID=2639451 RepID=UPI0013F6912D|nr:MULTISPECIES: dihydroxyacetone kinase family protein [unclassified Actinopolyspora]NHD19376.1 dihydroxyacetone kinase family protein [Actinopolyspora sp. BKK2]NHE78551.1 dihydroxyacetone kinase family protein [Actinopolyspora sp. BKK1]
MTLLYNDPARFTDDALRGFCDLHSDRVRAVTGGVVRGTPTPEGKVAVVIGGGSGHYPAFTGLVGPGFADGAVAGNIFTAPSAQQVHAVARAAHSDGGVLFGYGNYAGDVMNFGSAQERLRAEGIDCRTIVVTDDVASSDDESQRRGIAGDFAVFKIASAAAEEGLALSEVADLARRANARTRSLGIAFDGCTLPGQSESLFTVPAGKMALGLGIHGEPGISEVDSAEADRVADILVEGVLAKAAHQDSSRVAVLLNGLGATGHEELFVLWSRIATGLRAAGLTLVEPEVGELVTSLDMSGVSLTVTWLDEDLERLWCAPADAPAYGKAGGAVARAPETRTPADSAETSDEELPEASPDSRECAAMIAAVFVEMRAAVERHAEELGRIDAVAADGDHGRGMLKGVTAAARAATAAREFGAGAHSVLVRAADSWEAEAGGTSGALWGAGLRALASALSDRRSPDVAEIVAGIEGFSAAIAGLGRAEVGDKTMVDALVPFVSTFSTTHSWRSAAEVARTSAERTAELIAGTGRAKHLAERGRGTPDAGAVSFALLAETVAEFLERKEHSHG